MKIIDSSRKNYIQQYKEYINNTFLIENKNPNAQFKK